MTVESSSTRGLDLNSLIQSAIAGGTMSDLFGGKSDGSNFVMGALLGRLLFNQNDLNGNNNNADRAAIDAAVSAALANANQQNSNAMLLLKDIQDSTAEINQNTSQNAQTLLTNQLQNQISTLQGQSDIKNAITAGVGSITADLSNQINHVNTAVLSTANVTQTAIRDDGDKTRAAIAALAASIPNAREIELQRQLGVAEARLLQQDTHGLVRSGNVEVTNNISQSQAQAQQQQQIWNINNLLQDLLAQQKITQGIVNLGTMTGHAGAQTAANTRVNA